MATLTILIAAAPEHSQQGRFAFELARAARTRGHQVHLFGVADGVWHARPAPAADAGTRSLTEELARWLADGNGSGAGTATLEICSHSGQERGLEPVQLTPGASPSSTSRFGALVAESHRCLCLVP